MFSINIKSKNKKTHKINEYQYQTILSFHHITTLIILDNNIDIASVSLEGKLIIFELQFFSIKLNIQLTDQTLLDILKLSNNYIVITGWDKIIRVLRLYENNTKYETIQNLEGHLSYVNAIIEIKFYENETYLASSSTDAVVIIWKKENNNYKLSKKLENPNNQIESLIESEKYAQLICGSFQDCIIYFYDIGNFILINKLDVFINRCIRALNIINEDFLIAAGYGYIYLIDIKNHEIINNINFEENIEFNCVYVMKNNNILISQFDSNSLSGNLIQYSFDENKKELNKISSKIKMHDNYITTILELDNNIIITGGYDYLIKIWI